jgi:hypothetical protein
MIIGEHPGNDSCLIIASYAERARKAAADLEETITFWCPAEGKHAYTQHRDGKPAWCNACGFSADGTAQKDMCNHDEWMAEHGFKEG